MQIVDVLSDSILSLPSYLVDANKRIFGVYLLSALVLAIPAFLLHNKGFGLGAFSRYLFNKKVWWHASAKLDYSLLITNRILKALLWAPVVLTMVPIAMATSSVFETVFGTIQPLSNNATVIVACFTLILFLLDDLTRFILHWAMHNIPVLWDFHKVHHSAKVMTPFTIYRSHPFESYLYACRMALSQGLAVGIGYYLFGPTLSMFDVLGANLFVFVFNLMGSNLRHSHVWWGWGNRLEKWFISPAQHQIHHSDNPIHFDKNLGSALALWDKLAGSLVLSSSTSKVKFGIGKGDTGHSNIAQAYLKPFWDIKSRLQSGRKKTKSTVTN